MMMSDDKKKGVTVILESLMAKPAKQGEYGDEMDDSYAYKAAAEELISAIKAERPGEVAEAMKSFIEMCMMEADMEAEGQEESPES